MKFDITCTDFKPLHRNTLRGFAQISIVELRLRIRDVAIHEKGESRWAQLPAKAQLKDGNLVKNDVGKVQYFPILEFESRAVADAFSARVINALLQFSPQAFDVEDAA
jgi:hypothetical protein